MKSVYILFLALSLSGVLGVNIDQIYAADRYIDLDVSIDKAVLPGSTASFRWDTNFVSPQGFELLLNNKYGYVKTLTTLSPGDATAGDKNFRIPDVSPGYYFVILVSVAKEGDIVESNRSESFEILDDDVKTFISENVKCIFENSNTSQECYASVAQGEASYSFNGVYSAGGLVKGVRGERVKWKSSCGGYEYTEMDGKDEYIYFECVPEMDDDDLSVSLSVNGYRASKSNPTDWISLGSPSVVTIKWDSEDANRCNTYGQSKIELTDGRFWDMDLKTSGTKKFETRGQIDGLGNQMTSATIGVQCWSEDDLSYSIARALNVMWNQDTDVVDDSSDSGDVDPLQSSGQICVDLSYDLRLTSKDMYTAGQVSDLQFFLQMNGYLKAEPTGYFGLLTQEAVKKYQIAKNITPASGFVGPITRGSIEKQTCN